MNQVRLFYLLFLCKSFYVKGQSPLTQGPGNTQDIVTAFKPSLAVVIGILAMMFALTFILLMYAKFCNRAPVVEGDMENQRVLTRSRSQLSGMDKTVIESLPFFRFSTLKGWREGLECAVCLSKFEDIEILRLLPKCKHAFHIACVDQWLEKHSSCPLCRNRVSVDDLSLLTNSNSMRFLWNQRDQREESNSNLEFFVKREEDRPNSSRFCIGSSFRKTEKCEDNDDEKLLIQGEGTNSKLLHKLKHKVIVSDVVLKNRWSNVSSSDLMFLNSEMLQDMSSNRFTSLESKHEEFAASHGIEEGQIVKIKEEMEKKRLCESKLNKISKTDDYVPSKTLPCTSESQENFHDPSRIMSPNDKRSMSEIIIVPRFADINMKNRMKESSLCENDIKEEKMRKLWLPIARRTVQWYANRENRSEEQPLSTTTVPNLTNV
ncbi:Zinc finger, RING-type [Dillenia turbinata]|uniref:RING-type E3 ubiquitin transferase n=1 Tax=Dillenia turbinata TaxID=194707 RepID=A0AAN8W867_9MAGN